MILMAIMDLIAKKAIMRYEEDHNENHTCRRSEK
jgi:hypothetical protein